MRKVCKILFIFLFIPILSFGQRGKDYLSLEEALKNPEKVYSLAIRVFEDKPISEKIGLLKNLEKLVIAGDGKIRMLPQNIGRLKNLKSLCLGYDHISLNIDFLPNTIGNLKNLEEITIVSKQIKALPQNFENLVNLKKVYLKTSQIKKLPKKIRKLKNLQVTIQLWE